MTVPTFEDFPTPIPSRGQVSSVFNPAMNDFLAHLPTFVSNGNAVGTAINEAVILIAQAVLDSQNAVPFPTWTALAAATGMGAGDRATVIASDTETHTDPVVGGTVANAGVYEYNADPAGWGRIASLDSTLAAAQVALATIEKVAAQDAAGIAAGAVNYQGAYDEDTLYAIGESVDYLGGLFLKRTTAAAGTEPVDGVDWLELSAILTPNVAQTVKTDTANTASTAFVSTGMSVTITTQDDESKVLVMADMALGQTDGAGVFLRFVRSSSPLTQGAADGSRLRVHSATASASPAQMTNASFKYLDSPGAAGEHTYLIEWAVSASTGYINRSATDTDSATFGRAVSTLIAQEFLP